MRLETVADFELAAQMLSNSKTAFDHPVKSFGYCKVCAQVTEYDGNFSAEGTSLTCFWCNTDFSWPRVRGEVSIERYVTDPAQMSAEAREEIGKLHSPDRQKEFLTVILEEKRTQAKRRMRGLQNDIRKFAKLLSQL